MSENIFLFVPNLIGYLRIILAIASFYFMRTDYIMASTCYLVSAFVDCLDGYAARALNQATKFGAMLDQLTDRCATMCLLVTLSIFYPQYSFYFQMSMAIDIASHWLHLHTSLLSGRENHKVLDSTENPIMRIYYTSKPILFFMCAGNEMFYSGLYLTYFNEGPTCPVINVGLFKLITIISFPVAVVKTILSLLQMWIAAGKLGAIDVRERSAKRTD
ncbi:CDP-diacylglycerol--inositol 3-phosphatidyltransferase-like [Ornithodoros turicata]|uniref:CDP-diacylglycerol--inositol 3-phosphatidyltransferase-like n=1 Tax=Ornithodoros turicata TaxID=34597 RepID=UPI00313A3F17